MYVKWAIDFSEKGNFDESYEKLKDAVQYNTLNSEIYFNAAKNNFEQKNYPSTVEFLHKALEYDKQKEFHSNRDSVAYKHAFYFCGDWV